MIASVSVVIPAWDSAPYLGQALDSLRGQLPAQNIILVDNCSTRQLAVPDDIVKLRLDSRRTLGESRNSGLGLVKTPYVLFLDADDLLLSDALESLEGAFRGKPDLVAAVGRILGWRPSTGHLGPWGFPPRVSRSLQATPSLLALANVYRNMVPVVGAALLNTDAVRRAGGFLPSNRGEDWGLSVVLAFCGRVQYIDQPTMLYRIADGTLSSTGENIRAILKTRRTVRQNVRGNELVPWYGHLAGFLVAPAHWLNALRRRFHKHAGWGETDKEGALLTARPPT